MRRAVVLAALIVFVPRPVTRAQESGAWNPLTDAARANIALVPTSHPVVPRDISQVWFAPASASAPARASSADAVVAALKLADQGKYDTALPMLVRSAAEAGSLQNYAAYYAALAQLRLGRAAEARDGFERIRQRQPVGYLAEAAALGQAEAAEALDDFAGAMAIYDGVLASAPAAPEEILMRLGSAAKVAGNRAKAIEAFARVYYGSPLSPQAESAKLELDGLPDFQAVAWDNEHLRLELERAQRLFAGRQYTAAHTAFETLRLKVDGDNKDLVTLRLAESEYHLKRARNARESLRAYVNQGARQAEGRYFEALSALELGDRADYLTTIRSVIDVFPTESWAQEALNNLGTYYILQDEDAEADRVFRELYDKYRKGIYAERAAWKAGWRAYREGLYADTTRFFEQAAADFPRSDYRPAWLYWSGRAHERLGEPSVAEERHRLVATDYLNSYYGRLAAKRLGGRVPSPAIVEDTRAAVEPPLNEQLVRTLLNAGRYKEALDELRYAQRTWGDSAAIQATIAWTYRQQGQLESGMPQFLLLRGSITTMRRAYPQFLAAGGEDLPRDVLTVIYPVSYWDLIKKYSAQNQLDPYLVAALTVQESTFVPDIKSSAGAIGLMQLMPATARTYARKLNLTYSSRLLTTPESNIRMGTAYLADKIKEFGGVHLALASYNAGERAVRIWMSERPGLNDSEEFVDDIPYPETQTYVKRILGTAEDYRKLYGQ